MVSVEKITDKLKQLDEFLSILKHTPRPKIMLEADRLLKTVREIRGTGNVCKRGLYKFGTFEEADQWMEAMILSSSQESQP